MRLVISLWVRSEALNIDSAFQKIKGLCLEISKISWPPVAIVEHHNVGLKRAVYVEKTWPSRLIMEYMLNTQAKARQSEICKLHDCTFLETLRRERLLHPKSLA
jgi:hypothetical protein